MPSPLPIKRGSSGRSSKQASKADLPSTRLLPSIMPCHPISLPSALFKLSTDLSSHQVKNTYTPLDTIGDLQWMKTTLPPSTPKSPHRHSDGQTPPCHYCTPMQHPPSVRAYIRIYGCMWITTTAWPRCTWVDRMIDLYSQRKDDRHIEAFS